MRRCYRSWQLRDLYEAHGEGHDVIPYCWDVVLLDGDDMHIWREVCTCGADDPKVVQLSFYRQWFDGDAHDELARECAR